MPLPAKGVDPGEASADATGAVIEAVAQEVLGITLTASQQAALTEVTVGRDTLAVLPTGSGKSAIYQVAGLVLGGLTVVISPLIALQRDQIRGLSTRRRHGRQIGVALLNATQHVSERSSVIERLRRGAVDFLLLGPEQLANAETNAELLATARPVTLLAVDEAHLVSEWGHDFRPEYLRLAETARALGRPPILAVTATAAPPVQADITRVLDMHDPAVVVADFDRPNIALAVRRAHVHQAEEQSIADRTIEVVLDHDTPALVYAMSHARCEDISERLQKVAFKAAAYHAGLSAARRAQVQQEYFAGALDVVVATSAFGMGIDKPDVRTVVHAGVPASLDEYYQEIGRAGRDRQPAQAVLVYDPRTLRIPRLFAARSRIPSARVNAVLAALIAWPAPVAVADLVQASAVPRPTVQRILAELEELGFARMEDDTIVTTGTLTTADTEIDDAGRRRQAILGARIDSVRHYAETVNCRRAELLAYFGEAIDPPCDNCDNDAVHGPGNQSAAPSHGTHDMAGVPVVHRLWGPGTLLTRDEHELLVSFESVGYRHLSPSTLANGLLTIAAA